MDRVGGIGGMIMRFVKLGLRKNVPSSAELCYICMIK